MCHPKARRCFSRVRSLVIRLRSSDHPGDLLRHRSCRDPVPPGSKISSDRTSRFNIRVPGTRAVCPATADWSEWGNSVPERAREVSIKIRPVHPMQGWNTTGIRFGASDRRFNKGPATVSKRGVFTYSNCQKTNCRISSTGASVRMSRDSDPEMTQTDPIRVRSERLPFGGTEQSLRLGLVSGFAPTAEGIMAR